jgi:hypothetical protein
MSLYLDKHHMIFLPVSGEWFSVLIQPLTIKEQDIIDESEWYHGWQNELNNEDRQVYRLVNGCSLAPHVTLALISLHDMGTHLRICQYENAIFNRGSGRIYHHVAANLIGFVCRLSIEKGYKGWVGFQCKKALFSHYQACMGAEVLVDNCMVIDPKSAKLLSNFNFRNSGSRAKIIPKKLDSKDFFLMDQPWSKDQEEAIQERTGGKKEKKPDYRIFGSYKGQSFVKVGKEWFLWDAQNQRHIVG